MDNEIQNLSPSAQTEATSETSASTDMPNETPADKAARTIPNETYRLSASKPVRQAETTPQSENKNIGNTAYQSKLKGHEPNGLATSISQAHHFSDQLSKWPVVVGGTLVVLALCTILYNWVVPKPSLSAQNGGNAQQKPSPGHPTQLLEKAPNSVLVDHSTQSSLREEPLIPSPSPMNSNPAPMNDNAYSSAEPVDYQAQAQLQRQLQQEQEAAQREAARLARLQSAQESNSTVYSAASSNESPSSQTQKNATGLHATEANDILEVSNEKPSGPLLKGRLNAD